MSALLTIQAILRFGVLAHLPDYGELVQHLAMFDQVALGGLPAKAKSRPLLEWIDNLHEHFVDPATVAEGHYRAPTKPGASTEMRPESIGAYGFPNGSVWTDLGSRGRLNSMAGLSFEGRA